MNDRVSSEFISEISNHLRIPSSSQLSFVTNQLCAGGPSFLAKLLDGSHYHEGIKLIENEDNILWQNKARSYSFSAAHGNREFRNRSATNTMKQISDGNHRSTGFCHFPSSRFTPYPSLSPRDNRNTFDREKTSSCSTNCQSSRDTGITLMNILMSNDTSCQHINSTNECNGGRPAMQFSTPRESPASHESFSSDNRDSDSVAPNIQTQADHLLPIQLAKRNLHPVQSRISEWLREIKAILSSHCPSLMESPIEIQRRAISSLWSSLLLLIMIENKFSFTVSVKHSYPCPSDSALSDAANNSGQANRPIIETGNNNNNNNEAISTSLQSEAMPSKTFEKDLKSLIDDVIAMQISKEALAIIRSMLLATHLYPLHFPMSLEDLILNMTNIYYKDFAQLSKILSIPLRLSRFSCSHVTHLFCSHIVASSGSVEKYILKPDE